MSMTKHNLPEELLGQDEVDDSYYFTDQDLVDLKELEEENKAKNEALTHQILNDFMNTGGVDF